LRSTIDKCKATGYTLSGENTQLRPQGPETALLGSEHERPATDTVDKLRKMFAYLDNMEDPDELRALTSWKPHMLTGDRKGTWSLSVTRNRRLTFRIDMAEREICEVNLEDYH
jgi:proteic killer suppression protein